MRQRFTILGCGSSTGVPRVGNDWGACDPQNPKNRRRRCALLVEQFSAGQATTVLIDTGPDVREQLLSARVRSLDGVLFTHDHADHTHGIDDLRMLSYAMKRRVPVWMDAATSETLQSRFAYCFAAKSGSGYPAILAANLIEPTQMIEVPGAGGSIAAMPIPQAHGDIVSLGFRFGGIAYSPDVSDLSDASAAMLEGLDVWIVDALRDVPHPSHFSVKQALGWIERLRPKRAILTHLHIDLDYDALRRRLPPSVEPAYDGMTLEI